MPGETQEEICFEHPCFNVLKRQTRFWRKKWSHYLTRAWFVCRSNLSILSRINLRLRGKPSSTLASPAHDQPATMEGWVGVQGATPPPVTTQSSGQVYPTTHQYAIKTKSKARDHLWRHQQWPWTNRTCFWLVAGLTTQCSLRHPIARLMLRPKVVPTQFTTCFCSNDLFKSYNSLLLLLISLENY